MTEIQVTLNSRSVERFFFIIVILALAVLNVLQWTSDDGMTAKVTGNTEMQDVDPEVQAGEPEPTCNDGILNQDENHVDCGGACGGYWYDGQCNSEPQDSEPEQEIECRLNSDCEEGFKCEDNACIEIPPECEVDDDCAYNEFCDEGMCEEKELSGSVDVEILSVDVHAGTGENTKKVTAAKLRIENGKSRSVDIYAKAYVYESRSDPLYNMVQGGPFDIGSLKSGETVERFYNINGVSFQDDDEDRSLRIELYDDDDDELDSASLEVYP